MSGRNRSGKRKYVRTKPCVRAKPHNKVTETHLKLLPQLLEEGVSKAEISRTLGLGRTTVYRLIQRYCPEHLSGV